MKGHPRVPPRVFLVDDHTLLVEALSVAFAQSGQTKVVGCARSAEDAQMSLRQARADVALLDVVLPGRSGVDLARWVLEQSPAPKVIWMSHYADEDLFTLGKALGVSGFVSKRASLTDFERSILLVQDGRSVWPGPAGRERHVRPVPPERFGLSGRRFETLLAIANGLSTKQIAGQLGISTRTAEEYRSDVCGLLHVHSVAELVKFCIRNGWVDP